jgi:site-specific DNA recombinase
VWLGGIVPYGYRKVGEKKQARLALATGPMPPCKLSEVDVIRRIFKQAADGKSCFVIANDLNRIGVPPSYVIAGRTVLRGKRKQNTTGLWRPARVRNLIVSKTYMGVYEWGKRVPVRDDSTGKKSLKANPREKWITTACPPIVDKEIWADANAALHRNQIVAMAHAKNNYLLRGVIRCGLCGLTYIGMATTRPNGKKDFYYRCNGQHGTRGLYGEKGKRCPSPSVRGDALEAAVWGDLELFFSKPGALMRQLQEQMNADGGDNCVVADIHQLEAALAQKSGARQMALRQLTRERISETEFDQEIQSINREAAAIEAELAELRKRSADRDANARDLRAVSSLLERLRGTKSFEQRRRTIEALVDGITMTPVQVPGAPPLISVRYRFDSGAKRTTQHWQENQSFALDYTGRRACNKRDWSIKPECR